MDGPFGIPRGVSTAPKSVSNSDGTLTISPTTGAVEASLNLANANTWTAAPTFETGAAGASPVVVRQTGGTPGTDEMQLSNDGTVSVIESKSGGMNIKLPYENVLNLNAGGGNTHVYSHDLTLTAPGAVALSFGDYQVSMHRPSIPFLMIAASVIIDQWAHGSDNIRLALVAKAGRTTPLLQLQSSAGASLGNVGGTIFTDFADGASTSVDGTFNDLYTHTTIANTFQINGDWIGGRIGLKLVGHASATRQLKFVFAGTTIFDTTALTNASNADAFIDYVIVRVSATVVRYAITIDAPGLSAVVPPKVDELTGLTLTGTNILKLTGAAASGGAASGDITAKLQYVYRGEAA